ncbi:MAG: stage III sporulation protein AE, partial [Oscillospiraceae bacterium]|nr:stage III sporulation protein AE [Oscillospiraceae bacterium]
KAAGAAAGPIADSRISGLLGNIASAFGLMLGLVGSAGVVFFIGVVAAMKAVAA